MTTRNTKAPEKLVIKKFPLRLMPSVRKVAESVSQREGVSLNQFINLAVAEKVAHLQHDEWLAHRPKASQAMISKALEILDRPTSEGSEPEDEIPAGYLSVRSAPRS